MYLSKDPGSWQQYVRRADNIGMPLNELAKKYAMESNLYAQQMIMEAQMLQQQQITIATAPGGSLPIATSLPSNCIEFVNNISDGTGCTFWIESSASTNYTITWGDGQTETGEVNGVDRLELNHTYADLYTEYTVRLCFDNISLVTYLEFNGDD